MQLTHLAPGEDAIITAVSVEESLQHRLTALGFKMGKKISMIRRASFNGPLHVRLLTTDVMIRQSDAMNIEISPIASH